MFEYEGGKGKEKRGERDNLVELVGPGFLLQFREVSGLDFNSDFDPPFLYGILGGCDQHLGLDGSRVRGPDDEEDLGGSATISGFVFVVDNSVAASISGELTSDVFISSRGISFLFQDNVFKVIRDLEECIAELASKLNIVKSCNNFVVYFNSTVQQKLQ